jgi:hypothetical protein
MSEQYADEGTPATGIGAYVRVIWRHAVNLFSALCLVLAFVVVLPWWRGPWSIPAAAVCAAFSLLYATYLAWREATAAATASAPFEFRPLQSGAESILKDDLDHSLSEFRSSVSSTVAALGASGNRYSSALVNRLASLGIAELEKQAWLILNTWRRLLQPHLPRLCHDARAAVASSAVHLLAGQQVAIQEVVNAVDMRRTPRDAEFLADAFARCASRLRAELEIGARSNELGRLRII